MISHLPAFFADEKPLPAHADDKNLPFTIEFVDLVLKTQPANTAFSSGITNATELRGSMLACIDWMSLVLPQPRSLDSAIYRIAGVIVLLDDDERQQSCVQDMYCGFVLPRFERVSYPS